MEKKTVLALMDTRNEKNRILISKFIMDKGCIPLYPKIVSDFFSTVEVRLMSRDSQEETLKRCDQVWVFGEEDRKIKDLVHLAIKFRKPLKRFRVTDSGIKETG